MHLSEVTFMDAQPIESYGPGFFRFGGQVYHGGLLVLPNRAAVWGGYDDRAPLIEAAGSIDVLFIGLAVARLLRRLYFPDGLNQVKRARQLFVAAVFDDSA